MPEPGGVGAWLLARVGWQRKAAIPTAAQLSSVAGHGWTRIFTSGVHEPWTGAWQHNATLSTESVLAYFAVYACITLIASDISKMRLRLVEQDADGIWTETESPAFSPVLRKPNRYQTRIKFIEWWIVSKLVHGNTYALKLRDQRGVVVGLYILDPTRVKPMVSPDGSVFYALQPDNLSGLTEAVMVPAREIIHDVMCPLFHPLIGVSPLFACAMAALQGLKIITNSTDMFSNGALPSGILTAPEAISDETAERLKTKWEENFSGSNFGRVAVLGDGLEYKQMTMSSTDAQLIEQLKWTATMVCAVFHVPPYKIGIADPPSFDNVQALNTEYYAQALQNPIESIELLLDEGLGLVDVPQRTLGTEFDLDDLLRMDSPTMVEAESKIVGAGIGAPNESRKKFNLRPVKGGDSPMLQQQNYSLAALDRRDQAAPAPASPPVGGGPAQATTPEAAAKDHAFRALNKAHQAIRKTVEANRQRGRRAS